MGRRCKFYHGTWEELRAYKNTEYIENKESKQNAAQANINKTKNKKYVFGYPLCRNCGNSLDCSVFELFDELLIVSHSPFCRVGPKKMSVMDEYYDAFVGEDVPEHDYYDYGDYGDEYNDQ
jgi:hypothetical protein